MAELLMLFYVVVCGLWFLAVQHEGTIGIGARYLLVVHFASQFLVGPLVYWMSGELPIGIAESAYDKSLWIVLMGFLAFTVGGYVVAPWWVRRQKFRQQPAALFRQLLDAPGQWQGAKIVLGIGFLALVLSPIAGAIPTVRAVWSQTTVLLQTGAILLCLNGLHTKSGRRMAIGVMSALGAGLFSSVSSGFFGSTLLTLFYCSSLILLWRKVQFANWLVLGCVSVLSLIPYNMWLSGRDAIRSGLRDGASFSERAQAFWETTHVPGMADLTPSAQSGRIAERLDQSTILVAAVSHTPEIEPYARGETIWRPMLIAIVPRALWPDKPMSLGGSEFVSRFTGLRFGRETSVGLHPLFEFYVNFGPLGAVVGLLLLGIVGGVLDGLYFLYAPGNFFVQVLVLQILWALIGSATMAELTMTVPATILVAIGVVRVVHKYAAPARRPTGAKNLATARFIP